MATGAEMFREASMTLDSTSQEKPHSTRSGRTMDASFPLDSSGEKIVKRKTSFWFLDPHLYDNTSQNEQRTWPTCLVGFHDLSIWESGGLLPPANVSIPLAALPAAPNTPQHNSSLWKTTCKKAHGWISPSLPAFWDSMALIPTSEVSTPTRNWLAENRSCCEYLL